MPITINVNGLNLCHRGSGGVSHNTLPDVCKTPDKGTPVAYENEAYSKDLVRGTTTVFADGGHSIATYGSRFARSVFDEPGSLGGILSGTHQDEAEWITHSFDVFIEGRPACRLTDKMFMNRRNTVNLAGLTQPALKGFDAFKNIVCPKFCDLVRRIDNSEKLRPGESWTRKLHQELAENADDLAKLGVKFEKSAVVAAQKGAAAAWKRKAITKFGKSFGKKLILKAIPVIGWASTAWDVYDAAKLVKQGYDLMRVRPDFLFDSGGKMRFGDFKFPGDDWQSGQKEMYEALNGGEDPKLIDRAECDC